MSRVLLDTDLLSEVLRERNPKVGERAKQYLTAKGKLTLSSVTVFEVVRGWWHAGRSERGDEFFAWCNSFADVLPFDARCAEVAGRFGGSLSRSGTPIGVADVLIAATAIVHELPIGTGNTAHYERALPFGLAGIENWRD
jgi:tRNA(fMet)-specific endonuclease VapC